MTKIKVVSGLVIINDKFSVRADGFTLSRLSDGVKVISIHDESNYIVRVKGAEIDGETFDDPVSLLLALAGLSTAGGGGGSSDVSWADITDVPASLTANQAAGTASVRTLGTGATQAAAGNHTHSAATTSAAGFMSGADKTKLDGIAAGATVGSTWAAVTDKPATFAPTIGTTATTAKAGNWTPPNVTTSANGLMLSADKVKLDGVATGATANDTNANLLNRANHTGTQAFSTISGVATAAQIPNLASSKVTSLTGYVVGTATALAAADSLNAALGKLEARLVALETAGG